MYSFAVVNNVTERVSLATDESEADSGQESPLDISPDGRFVTFTSFSTNLVGVDNDTNSSDDVYIRDRVAGTTERVSVGTGGYEADGNSGFGSVSADGRIVAFKSQAFNLGNAGSGNNIYVHDRQANSTDPLTECPPFCGDFFATDLSDDSRFVAYQGAVEAWVVDPFWTPIRCHLL
jgi:Tol biopolymer transport system component